LAMQSICLGSDTWNFPITILKTPRKHAAYLDTDLCEDVQVCCGHRLLPCQHSKVLHQDTIKHLRGSTAQPAHTQYRQHTHILTLFTGEALQRTAQGCLQDMVAWGKQTQGAATASAAVGSAKRNSKQCLFRVHREVWSDACVIIPNSSSSSSSYSTSLTPRPPRQ
jgi:hypothetical protein